MSARPRRPAAPNPASQPPQTHHPSPLTPPPPSPPALPRARTRAHTHSLLVIPPPQVHRQQLNPARVGGLSELCRAESPAAAAVAAVPTGPAARPASAAAVAAAAARAAAG